MKITKRKQHNLSKNKTDIYLDEFGELGNDPKQTNRGYRPSRFFGIGATDTTHRPVLNKIGNYFSKLEYPDKTGELKAKKIKNPKRKQLFARFIRKTGNHQGFYVDKLSDTPKGWEGYNGSERLIGFLIMVIEWYLKYYPGVVLSFHIDDHNSYKANRELIDENIRYLEKEYRQNIDYEFVNSSKDKAMQAHDLVPHALFEEHEMGNPALAQTIGINENELGAEDSIVLYVTKKDDEDGPVGLHNRKNDAGQEFPQTFIITANGAYCKELGFRVRCLVQ